MWNFFLTIPLSVNLFHFPFIHFYLPYSIYVYLYQFLSNFLNICQPYGKFCLPCSFDCIIFVYEYVKAIIWGDSGLREVIPAEKSMKVHRAEIFAQLLVDGQVVKSSAIPSIPLMQYTPQWHLSHERLLCDNILCCMRKNCVGCMRIVGFSSCHINLYVHKLRLMSFLFLFFILNWISLQFSLSV